MRRSANFGATFKLPDVSAPTSEILCGQQLFNATVAVMTVVVIVIVVGVLALWPLWPL